MDIIVSLEKLGYCVEEIYKCSSSGASGSKGKLILKQMAVIRMCKNGIEELLDY